MLVRILSHSHFFKAEPHRDLEMRKFWISCIHLKRMLRSFTCLRALFFYVYIFRCVCLSLSCVRVLLCTVITSFDLFIQIWSERVKRADTEYRGRESEVSTRRQGQMLANEYGKYEMSYYVLVGSKCLLLIPYVFHFLFSRTTNHFVCARVCVCVRIAFSPVFVFFCFLLFIHSFMFSYYYCKCMYTDFALDVRACVCIRALSIQIVRHTILTCL